MSEPSSQILVHYHQQVITQEALKVPQREPEEKLDFPAKQKEDHQSLSLNVLKNDQSSINNHKQLQHKQIQPKHQPPETNQDINQHVQGQKNKILQLLQNTPQAQQKGKQVQKQLLRDQAEQSKQEATKKSSPQDNNQNPINSKIEKKVDFHAVSSSETKKTEQIKEEQLKKELNHEIQQKKQDNEEKLEQSKSNINEKILQHENSAILNQNNHTIQQNQQPKIFQNHLEQQPVLAKKQEKVFRQNQTVKPEKIEVKNQEAQSNVNNHQQKDHIENVAQIKKECFVEASQENVEENSLHKNLTVQEAPIIHGSSQVKEILTQEISKNDQISKQKHQNPHSNNQELLGIHTVDQSQLKNNQNQQIQIDQKEDITIVKAVSERGDQVYQSKSNQHQQKQAKITSKDPQESKEGKIKPEAIETSEKRQKFQDFLNQDVKINESIKNQPLIQQISTQTFKPDENKKHAEAIKTQQYHQKVPSQLSNPKQHNQEKVEPQRLISVKQRESQNIETEKLSQIAVIQQSKQQRLQTMVEKNQIQLQKNQQKKQHNDQDFHAFESLKEEQLQGNGQKQKYRINTDYHQSVNQQNKQKDNHTAQIVQFTQFVPNQQKDTISPLKDLQAPKDIDIKPQISPLLEVKENQQEELKMTFKPNSQQIEPQLTNQLKPTQIMRNIVDGNQSPKKEAGKIAKKTLHDIKVHQIVKELNKYDEKKAPIPNLKPPKKASKKNIDLSKLDANIQLISNVMNVTVGQPTKDGEVQNAQKLLNEIQSLKIKLSVLQKRKEERINQVEENENSEKTEQAIDNLINFKATKKQFTGKIYKRIEPGQSRLSESIQQFNSDKKSQTIAIEPATISSASKNRMTSTLGFQTQKQIHPDSEADLNKTMMINFRVRRPSKSIQGFQLQSNEKVSNKKSKVKQDQCFQTSRREDVYEKLEFTEEQSLTTLEKPVQRQLVHEPYFRELIEKYFIDIGKQFPNRQMDQAEFVNLAKVTFKKFGVNLEAERSAALSVKKYKNCISFVLDSARTIIWYYQGKFYFGGWSTNKIGEGEKSGWGYEYVPGKYVYSGTFLQNKRHGYGIIKFLARQNDTIYQGAWTNGFKQGLGKQLENDEVEYIGSWAQGKKHGYGTLRISQYEYYSGNFVAGIKNGEGIEVFKNGDRYVGNYKEGKFEGKGTYTWSNYSKYEGDFVQGSRNGYGHWVANHLDPNSDRYEGEYKNDKKNGFGVYKWKDGTTYQGEFLNDLKHGEGTVSYGDGRKANLQWFQGSVLPRPPLEKQQRNKVRRGSSKASSQKSDSKSRRFDGNKISQEMKLKGKKVPNGIQS